MHGVASDDLARMPGSRAGERALTSEPPRAVASGPSPDWRQLGLESMASMLVLALHRVGSGSFEAACQWPRLHPLNERVIAVRHHPMLMAESTRQLSLALQGEHLPIAGDGPLEAVSVRMGWRLRAQPVERGSATTVAVALSVGDLANSRCGLTAFRLTAEYRYAGIPFGTCSMRLARPATPEVPAACTVNSSALLHPPAAVVGAGADLDVMLARAPQGRILVMPRDPGHPALLGGRAGRLPALGVLEAGRQAVLLNAGTAPAAVAGLRVDLHGPVPPRGALVETMAESGSVRFLMTSAGAVCAEGSVMLLRP
ncbi:MULTISPECIES: AfsA-related hotdog domain-containing protein [unclassified Streptomyces]|uniref:AfsA-related hotdog domain-containing protein n=1 Tax=unclassified Streptomyces TaxID=2593676 RepID=UPI003691FFFD